MRRHSALTPARAAPLARRLVDRIGLLLLRAAPGQGLVEYGLVLVLIMVVCVGILSLLGTTISTVWYDQLINSGAWD